MPNNKPEPSTKKEVSAIEKFEKKYSVLLGIMRRNKVEKESTVVANEAMEFSYGGSKPK